MQVGRQALGQLVVSPGAQQGPAPWGCYWLMTGMGRARSFRRKREGHDDRIVDQLLQRPSGLWG